MKIGNVVEWTVYQPGFPKKFGVITHTFRYPRGAKAGQVASHRVSYVHNGEVKFNTFRPRDLTVLG